MIPKYYMKNSFQKDVTKLWLNHKTDLQHVKVDTFSKKFNECMIQY